MSKFVGFMIRLGEDIYQAKREQINKWYDIHEISTDENPEVEPATSIESVNK